MTTPVRMLLAAVFLSVLLAACAPPATTKAPATPVTTASAQPTSTPVPSSTATTPAVIAPEPTDTPAQAGLADVEFVKAVQAADGTWTFSVTVRHPDTGWEDYADGWDVITPDGQVLKVSPDDPFTRLLLHPHVNEQPFTRSQSRIRIPDDVTRVTVRAHSLTRGFGGREVVVDLTQSSGQDFEVQHSQPLPTPESRVPRLPAAYTYPRPDGNHVIAGRGDLPNLAPLDIPLDARPMWVVGMPWQAGVVWAVAFDNGGVQGFYVTSEAVSPFDLGPATLRAGMPPVLILKDKPVLLPLPGDIGPNTHPIVIPDGTAHISPDGDLVIQQGDSTARLQANTLTDARILYDGEDHLLVLADPSQRYPHGVLGDRWEATSVLLVQLNPPAIETWIDLPEPWVNEGVAPLWADITGDGQREIILTRSSMDTGAQIAVYSQQGELLGTGEAIGQGRRWRHVIAAAPFAGDGIPELVDVLTPHIGGPVEFFRWQDGGLTPVAQADGYTSHVIHTRNLDMAVAGDFDGDGALELLLPNQQRTRLGAIRRTDAGAEAVWQLPLEGVLSTNLAAITLPEGGLALAAGQENNTLRVWQLR